MSNDDYVPFYNEDRTKARRWASSTAEFELDAETELPKVLHKGAYFRVVKESDSRATYSVRYMVRRLFRSDRALGTGHVYCETELTKYHIIWGALGAIEEAAWMVEQQEIKDHNTRWLGNYPPKSVNG